MPSEEVQTSELRESTVEPGDLSDPSLYVQSPDEILLSLDPRARRMLAKDPVFKSIVASMETLPVGSNERERQFKKLIDYVQERMVAQ